MRNAAQLAYWYRLDRPRAGLLLQETDANWSVADKTGTPAGAVRFTTTGLTQAATYWVMDAGGGALVGFAERDDVLLGIDGQPVGALKEPTVWWAQQAVGKFQVRLAHDPHRFDGAWMWDATDQVVASVTQTRTEGVGAYLQLDRPPDLPEPLATATLVLPLVAHLALMRATQQDIHRRFRRSDRGLTHFGGEKSDLL